MIDTMPTVRFVKEKRDVEVPAGTNLRQAAIKAGISVYEGPHKLLNCRGFGMCASCRVRITQGSDQASPMAWFEKLRLASPVLKMMYVDTKDPIRLACRMQVNGDMEVETCPEANLHGEPFWA